jgi:hypothetical protein
MAQAQLQITKDGTSGILFIGIGRDHSWRLDRTLPWFDGMMGRWVRRTNSTKFRQFSFIELVNNSGVSVARMQEFPYRPLQRFQADLVAHLWIFETSGDPFDVVVLSAPPDTKQFQISENWSGALSYVVGQAEVCGFEIFDPATNERESYVYHGLGISIGPPIPRLPNLTGGVTGGGPPNDFTAPGWMTVHDFDGDATLQTFYNVGLGTSVSRNRFEFAGHVDNFPGFLATVPDLQTGHTLSLPGTGFSSGSMSHAVATPPVRPR